MHDLDLGLELDKTIHMFLSRTWNSSKSIGHIYVSRKTASHAINAEFLSHTRFHSVGILHVRGFGVVAGGRRFGVFCPNSRYLDLLLPVSSRPNWLIRFWCNKRDNAEENIIVLPNNLGTKGTTISSMLSEVAKFL